MTKRDENKITMLTGIDEILYQNESITSTIAAFAPAITGYRNILGRIGIAKIDREEASKGKAENKQIVRKNLEAKMLKIGNALFAYASSIRNVELKAQTKVTKSGLTRMRDTDLLTKGESLLGFARANEDELRRNYGANIGEFATQLSLYNHAIGQRESGESSRIAAGQELKNLLNEAMNYLTDNLDPLVALLKEEHSRFYDTYFEARDIKDIGIRHKKEEPAKPE